jgi:hypothetical protein
MRSEAIGSPWSSLTTTETGPAAALATAWTIASARSASSWSGATIGRFSQIIGRRHNPSYRHEQR